MSEHTKGPWIVDRTGLHVFTVGERKLVAGCGGHQDNFTPDLIGINQANARRIVACVNACEGYSTDLLEKIAPDQVYLSIAERDLLKSQVAELEALSRELAIALIYWMPGSEPLQDQHDAPSEAHKAQWHKDHALIARAAK